MDANKANFAEMLQTLKSLGQKVNSFLKNYPLPDAEPALKKAMLYSLSAGGKRIRPALCITFAKAAGCAEKEVLPFACAIEMIHTYSLIHDDLPAMDNDDLRRGKPSCHKAFDEATAILAGDGLLTDAFLLALSTSRPDANVLEALRALAQAAGSAGMVGGQMQDMLLTGKSACSLADLASMQALKTGAMLRAACVCGVLLGPKNAALYQAANLYGTALGCAFQIMDDILDETGSTEELGKPAGSDQALGKLTWPAVAGMEQSYQEAKRKTAEAIDAATLLAEPEKSFLINLAEYVIQRKA